MSGTAFSRLPQALRLLRKRRGWTQRELAAAVGFTVKQVSAYETGRQRPRIETLERILEQLQASARVLAQTMAAFDERPAASGPPRAVRDGKPYPARSANAARASSYETVRGLAKRLPALRLLAEELAVDVVTATAEGPQRRPADRRRDDEADAGPEKGSRPAADRKPQEAK